ncbi:hypothetical protein [Streptomyces sp. BK239]|uniref:hypothetical protein n=1 Tax=Streptomyces sp. BK239 TaxID=2512155 RepID=UPI00102C1D10|nr:hypothetical protein [Streptomyces sp. BK239]RZU17037.1 hypothetical protein EV567_3474 [Streptomyces sp. BK239]
MNVRRNTAAATVVVLILTGAVGCAGAGKGVKQGAERSAAQVLTAAYEKTSEAKSAKVTMTVSMPTAMKGGGDMKMSGIMGWDPAVMDLTMESSALAQAPGAPERVRMIMRDNIMYLDMGDKAPAELDGKRWMKMDLTAMAEATGNPALRKQMSSGLENMNQDPAQQLAMLLDSPNLKHVGSEKIGGEQAEHYKGTLTVKEMLEANDSLGVLDPKKRAEVLKQAEKAGIKGYDTDVWVNGDDLPARMDIGMDAPQGKVRMSMTFSDYGAKAVVKAPPADQTFDLAQMFKEIAKGVGESGGDPALDKELSDLESEIDVSGLEPAPAV